MMKKMKLFNFKISFILQFFINMDILIIKKILISNSKCNIYHGQNSLDIGQYSLLNLSKKEEEINK